MSSSADSSIFDYCIVTHGKAIGDYPAHCGGGIFINTYSSIPNYIEISNSKIANNSANAGGGIYTYRSGVIIENCLISNNISNLEGGGMYLSHHEGIISNSTIRNNHANSGGGLWSYNSSTEIRNCIIEQNNSDWSGSGVELKGGKSIISNCLISENSSTRLGSGISIVLSHLSQVYNCNIINNYGESLYLHTSDISVLNSIIRTKNSDIEVRNHQSDPAFYNCNLKGGNTFNALIYKDCIDADPLFTDSSNNDYTLKSNSPCINAGDTVGISNLLQKTDFNGNLRIWDDIIDIGAYEYIPEDQKEGSIALSDDIDFGDVFLNTTEIDSFVIENSGNIAVEVTDIELPEGIITNWDSGTIDAGDNQIVNVSFTPTEEKTYNGTITVNSTGDVENKSIAITGSGIIKRGSFSLSDNIDFGDVNVNTTKLDSLTITNTGNIPIEITDIELPDCITTNWNSGVINVDNQQIVKVSFTPTDKKSYSGTITVNSTEDIESKSISIAGSGSFPTAITEKSLDEVVIFPNPFSNEITIKNNFKLNSLTITNSFGQKVLFIENPESTINTEALDQGVYFITIENDKNQKVVRKFIKR